MDKCYYVRKEKGVVLIDTSGKEYDPLKSLPSLEDPFMKDIIEKNGIPHLIFGQRWYIYDSDHLELETIEAKVLENGQETGEIIAKEFLTMKSVERARAFWKGFVNSLGEKENKKNKK